MKPRVAVAGSVGADRIWHLEQPLRAGARLTWSHRSLRVGGAASNAAAALLWRGHPVDIATWLGDDPLGDRIAQALAQAGLDLAGIVRVSRPTLAGDILLDPRGERTLLAPRRQPRPIPEALFRTHATVAYFNAKALTEPARLRSLAERLCLVAQLPDDLHEPRWARILIASRSDVGALPAIELLRQRQMVDDGLEAVVVTDGAHGAELANAAGCRAVPARPIAEVTDSIGAGDFFAAGLAGALAEGFALQDAILAGHDTAATCLTARPAPVGAWLAD